MRTLTEQEHIKIKRYWKFFPYKLDYIIGLILSENKDVYDISFIKNNDIYEVIWLGPSNKDCANYHQYFITVEDMFSYCGIDGSRDFVPFVHNTTLFNSSYSFRGQKSLIMEDDIIMFRTLFDRKASNFTEYNSKIDKFYWVFGLSCGIKNSLF